MRIAFVREQFEKDLCQSMATLHFLAVSEAVFGQTSALVGDVFEVAASGESLDHFGGRCRTHAEFGGQIPRPNNTTRGLFVKFIHHFEVFVLELLEVPNHGPTPVHRTPSWDLNTCVQAGQRTEPAYVPGILSVCAHSGQPTSTFSAGVGSASS